MSVNAQDAGGPPPAPLARGGRPRVYPYRTMSLGQMFFVAGGDPNSVGPHAYRLGPRLGRKFSTRVLWMLRTPKGWEHATEDTPGAEKGVAVYRVE